MEFIIQKICEMDVGMLVAMAGMFWMFNTHLNKKFDKIDQKFDKIDQRFDKVDQRFDKVDQRFDKIERVIEGMQEDIRELRTSINPMEGAFYNKDCCMLKSDQKKKAE